MEAIREGIQEGIQLVKEQIPPHVFERWHSFQKVLKKKLLLIPRCIKYIFNVTLPISSCIGTVQNGFRVYLSMNNLTHVDFSRIASRSTECIWYLDSIMAPL